MKHTTKILLLAGLVALSACAKDGRGGAGFGGKNAGALGGSAGSVSDPTSQAYFQEAIGDRVLFEVDQSTLTDEAEAILMGQARWLLTNVDYSAIIEGHADEQGTRAYNMALGARRASTVMEFLVSQGVSPARLKIITYGKERPLALCSEESCYAQNRRAVTVLTAGGLS